MTRFITGLFILLFTCSLQAQTESTTLVRSSIFLGTQVITSTGDYPDYGAIGGISFLASEASSPLAVQLQAFGTSETVFNTRLGLVYDVVMIKLGNNSYLTVSAGAGVQYQDTNSDLYTSMNIDFDLGKLTISLNGNTSVYESINVVPVAHFSLTAAANLTKVY